MKDSQYALISGASQGLGKALSLEYATRGMSLILVALPESGLPELASEIREKFRVAVIYAEKDLRCLESCLELLELVKKSRLNINVLVNNLGGGSTENITEGKLAEYENQVTLNVLTTLRLTHLFIPLLRKAQESFILNVGSLAAYFTLPQKGVYAASKSFIVSFSLTLREELKETNICVSVVCPSGMPTNEMSIQLIRRGSLITRISCMSPQLVARIAVSGMFAKKRVIIPGILNKIFFFMGKMMPGALKRILLYPTMNRLKKRADSGPNTRVESYENYPAHAAEFYRSNQNNSF